MHDYENILKNITDNLDDGIILIDSDYRVTFANSAIHRSFGFPVNAGTTCHDLFHRQPSPCHVNFRFKQCPHNEVFKTGKPVSLTYQFVLKDGDTRTFNVQASPIKDKNNEVVQVIKVLRDISEKKQTEQLLKDSEIKYRSLVDNALIGAYKTNLNGDILYVNKALAIMMEFDTPQEMINSNAILWYKNPGDRQNLISGLREKGSVNNFEFDLITQSSKIRHALLSAHLDKEIITGMIMDITERKKMEVLSKKQEIFFSSILESMQDGMVVVNNNFEILYANSSYINQSGVSPDEIKGRHCYEVSHKNTKPCYLAGEECSVKKAFDTGHSNKIIHKHCSNGHEKIHVETEAYPLKDLSGKVVSVLERVRDISEKLQLEKELKRRVRELEEFYDMAVGREMKMIELKKEIEDLNVELSAAISKR